MKFIPIPPLCLLKPPSFEKFLDPCLNINPISCYSLKKEEKKNVKLISHGKKHVTGRQLF